MELSNDDILKSPFLSVGCKRIVPELFCMPSSYLIKDDRYKKGSYKPTGGFWTTYDTGSTNSNDWLMHMARLADYYEYNLMNRKYSPNVVSLKLKEDASILVPDSITDLLILKEWFPVIFDKNNTPNNLINYTQLSKKYDGIYVNKKLIKHPDLIDWDVPTLVLLNLDAIDTYQHRVINNYHDGCWLYEDVETDSEIRRINPMSEEYQEIFEQLNKLYVKIIKDELTKGNFTNYYEFVENVRTIFDKLIENNQQLFEHLQYDVIPKLIDSSITRTSLYTSEYNKYLSSVGDSLNSKLRYQNYDLLDDVYTRGLKK